jgi:hypothetical protein
MAEQPVNPLRDIPGPDNPASTSGGGAPARGGLAALAGKKRAPRPRLRRVPKQLSISCTPYLPVAQR